MISQINKDNTRQVFSLDTFNQKYLPDNVGSFDFDKSLHNEQRLNHYLIKNKNESVLYMEHLHYNLKEFINTCISVVKRDIPDQLKNRYIYLTFDNEVVKAGDSQRDQGWHVDGLQGDEVKSKVNNCFQFITFDCLPTIFSDQAFNFKGKSLSKDNIFNCLGDQVVTEKHTQANNIYFMNPYMPHKAQVSNKCCKRLFMRLYFSHLPITSVKATINPFINYNFKPHTTSGQIPNHLK